MTPPAVSVIVPVYNVAQYLPRCLDSLRAQTLEDLEIICINDGSTDHSLHILEQYAARDSRIIVISTENRGLSAARNRGMDAAAGEYIGFVDSDDYIREDMFAKMLAAARLHQADLVQCRAEIVFGDSPEKPENAQPYLEQKQSGPVKNTPALLHELPQNTWLKLIRRDFLQTSSVRFPEGLLYEDLAFHYMLLPLCRSIVLLDDLLYYYRNRPGSIMQQKRTANARLMEHLDIVEKVEAEWKKQGVWEPCRLEFLKLLVYAMKRIRSQAPHSLQQEATRRAITLLQKTDAAERTEDHTRLGRKERTMIRAWSRGRSDIGLFYYWKRLSRRLKPGK